MEWDKNSRWYAFFAREGAKLVRFVRGRVRQISEMDAEDIVADVMLHLVSRLDTAGPVENIAAYAYRSIRNRIADYERGRARMIRLEDCVDEDGELPLLSMLASGADEPADREERAELLLRLSGAIGRLEPRQRAVLIATELNGRSFRELSEAWGEPMGTLLSRKSRAMQNLRRMLTERNG